MQTESLNVSLYLAWVTVFFNVVSNGLISREIYFHPRFDVDRINTRSSKSLKLSTFRTRWAIIFVALLSRLSWRTSWILEREEKLAFFPTRPTSPPVFSDPILFEQNEITCITILLNLTLWQRTKLYRSLVFKLRRIRNGIL